VSYFVRLLWVVSLASGCNGERPTDTNRDDDTDDPSGPECAEDIDCGSGRICEGEVCVRGDRDDEFEGAGTLRQETEISAEIYPEGDVDLYAYESPGGEWLRVETVTEEEEGGLDTVVAVYRSNGALHAYMDDYPTGDVTNFDTVLYVYLPDAGTWYFAVEDRLTFLDPDEDSPEGDYTLLLKPFGRYTDDPDSETDPSVQIDVENASTIYAAGVVLDEIGDSDWIDLSIPWARAPIEIYGHSEIPGSPAIAQVNVYDPDLGLILAKEDLGPAGAAFYMDTEEKTYVVEATDADGDGSKDHWYVLYFRTNEVDTTLTFETEPNDASETATWMDTRTATADSGEEYEYATFTGTLDPDGDVDFYSITAPADHWITVYCSADRFGSQLDPILEVFGPDGASIGTADDGDDLAPDVANLGPVDAGIVTMRIGAGDAGDVTGGPSAYYRCTVYASPFEVST
jgi:hypothetical protein